MEGVCLNPPNCPSPGGQVNMNGPTPLKVLSCTKISYQDLFEAILFLMKIRAKLWNFLPLRQIVRILFTDNN